MLITAFLFAAVTAATGVTPPGDAASTKKTQVPSNPAPSRDELPSAHGMGQWLVDLARHQGHLVGRGDPRSSSLHVLAILKAAVEVDPGCPEAYYWLYDLETRLDRGDAAVEALRSYVKLAPGDEAARLRLFELDLAGRQTAEDRLSFVEGELAREGVPRAYESHLHGQLARHYFERRENGAAAKEVEKALRLNPMNVDARRVAFEMFGETEPSLQRVEMALQLIAANPSQTNLVWGLGEYMDRLGLHGQAQEWFNRAIQFHEQSQTGPVPADYWHKLAVSYFNAKEYERAINAADKALKADENLHLARLLRATALGRLNRADEQAADIALVEAAYRSETDKAVESNDRARLAEIAWFHAFHKRDAEKALKLAEMAMKENEPSALAKLAHAHALRLSGKTDEAIPLLKSLAAFDQLAAYELARIQIEQDKKAEALTTLHKAATLQYDGVAFEMIADLLRKYDESPPVAPQHTRIAEAHNRFNRDVFDYIRRPADFLSVTMKFVDESLPIPGPVRVIFRIENIGPFPITLGEGFMARPLIAVTAMINGSETFDKYLQVLLNARPVLLPGDAIEKTVAIDVGPIQKSNIKRCAEPLQLRVLAMFDPVLKDGQLTTGTGTIQVPEINATRRAIAADKPGVDRLVSLAASAAAADRIQAADQIGALLAAVEAAPASGALAGVPLKVLHAELAKLLNDEDWPVRAHAVVAAGWSSLEPRVIAVAASPRVRNEGPVVRMLATRLFAEQHGAKFRKVLEQMADADESEYVRLMAASYLPADYRAQRAPAEEPTIIPASSR